MRKNKYLYLKGTIQGDLQIIDFVNNPKNGKNVWRWKCECSCGNIIYVRTSRLNGKEAKQERCGKCQKSLNGKSKTLPNYGSIKNSLYQRYMLKAEKRKAKRGEFFIFEL